MTTTSPADIAPRSPYTDEEIRRYTVSGDWQHRVLVDIVREHAAQQPDKVFVTDGDRTLTYGGLAEQGIRLAAGLHGLGVTKGERVAVQMPNWAEFAVVAVALSRLGAVLVPIMPIFRQNEVGFNLAHSGAIVAIAPSTFNRFDYLAMYGELRESDNALRSVVVARSDDEPLPEGTTAFDDLMVPGDLDAIDAALPPTASPDDLAVVVYTSGTTSRPKGCVHTFNTVHASAVGMIRRLRIDQNDVFFNPSPVCHSTGLVTGLVMPLLIGAATHFMPKWEPAEGARRIKEYGCTATWTSTTFLTTTMQAYDPAVHDLSSMRYWICAGSPIPGSVVGAAREMFPTCTVLSLYGRSENMTTTMCSPDDPAERAVESDGRALESATVIVVDENGLEVPRGESGDIAYRGPSHMLGYYADPENTADLWTPDGYSRSGDLGYMDAAGFVRVSGRIKDIIIRGGINISAREVEDMILTHESVRDVALVSMPDARLGERACAFVVLTPGAEPLTLQDVAGFLRERKIAAQKLPERVEVIDALPMTAVGKVRKNVLRDRIAAIMAEEQSGVSTAG